MAQTDAFVLPNSGLNRFLHAEVGTELNGSALTILSVLARLGQDPWTEAARWARMPKGAIIDSLTKCIGQMPLSPQALRDARLTASRLVLLLPGQGGDAPAPATGASAEKPASTAQLFAAMPRWLPLAVCLLILAMGFAITISPAKAPVIPPTVETPVH
jgi:hypothetical protein